MTEGQGGTAASAPRSAAAAAPRSAASRSGPDPVPGLPVPGSPRAGHGGAHARDGGPGAPPPAGGGAPGPPSRAWAPPWPARGDPGTGRPGTGSGPDRDAADRGAAAAALRGAEAAVPPCPSVIVSQPSLGTGMQASSRPRPRQPRAHPVPAPWHGQSLRPGRCPRPAGRPAAPGRTFRCCDTATASAWPGAGRPAALPCGLPRGRRFPPKGNCALPGQVTLRKDGNGSPSPTSGPALRSRSRAPARLTGGRRCTSPGRPGPGQRPRAPLRRRSRRRGSRAAVP